MEKKYLITDADEFLLEIEKRISQQLKSALEGFQKREVQEDVFYSEQEICKLLKISRPTCIKLRKEGKLPYKRIGNKLLYSKQAVLSALQKQLKKP